MDLYGFALFALSSLFAVIDPLGCIPFFSGLTAGRDTATKRRILIKSLLISLAVLLVFAYAGSLLLHAFGITINAFRIAGGVIFFGIGLDMLQSRPRRWRTGINRAYQADQAGQAGPDHVADEVDDPSVTHLDIPMLSGPGSITTVMVLRAEAVGLPQIVTVGVAALAILILTGFILIGADTVLRRLGQTGMRIVEKLMGLMVTVIAVQLIMNGLSPYLKALIGG